MKHTLDIKPIFEEYCNFLDYPDGKDPKAIILLNETRLREFAREVLAEVIADIRLLSVNPSAQTAAESLLLNTFNEFIKNSADSLKKIKDSGQTPNTNIEVYVEEDKKNPDHILISIEDHGKGFIDKQTGQVLTSQVAYGDYQDAIGHSEKKYQKDQLGGAGLGLGLSTQYLGKNEGTLMVGPRRAALSFDCADGDAVSPEALSSGGAVRFTSPKTPYITSYDEQEGNPLTEGERPMCSFFLAGSLAPPPTGKFGKRRAAQQTQATSAPDDTAFRGPEK